MASTVTASANYEGNGRGFWNGNLNDILPNGVYNPHSTYSKQATLIKLDTAQINPEVANYEFEGPSKVSWPRCYAGYRYSYCRGTRTTTGQAAAPPPPRVVRLGRDIVVDIDMETSLPLMPSPNIISRYHLVFDTVANKLHVTGAHTLFPWQELYVTGLGRYSSIERFDPVQSEPWANPGYLQFGQMGPLQWLKTVNATVPLPPDPGLLA